MAIQVRGANYDSGFTSGDSIDKPGGTDAGDLLLLHVGVGNSGDGLIPPDGFALIHEDAIIDANRGIRIYAKRAGASEPTSYTIVHSGISSSTSVGIISIYSDTGDYLALDDFSSQSNASSTTVEWPSVTTSVVNTLLLCFATINSPRDLNTPAGMTRHYPVVDSTSYIHLYSEAIASTGATGTRTTTFAASTAQSHRVISLAIREQTIPGDSRVTQAGVYAEISTDEIRITQAGAYFEVIQDEIRVTQAGVYFEILLPSNVGLVTGLRAIATSERSIYLEASARYVLADASGYNWQVSSDGENWSSLASTAIGTLYYHHQNLTPETTYYYRVQASPGGDWSNIVQATTPPALALGGRALWVDVEDAAGKKLGEGPLLELTRARVTLRLDRAGDFDLEVPLAYQRGQTITTDRYIRIHARLKDQAEEVFYGPVEKIGRRMSANDEMRTVNGPDIGRELARAKVWDKTGNAESAAPTYWVDYADAGDVPSDLVNTYAPSGWSFTGSNLADAWSGRFFYDSVLSALGRIVEEKGEHFRFGTDRTVNWLGRLNPGNPSGVRAVHGVSLESGTDHDELCLVTHVEEVEDAWEQVTRVYASGGDYLGHPLTTFEATQVPAGVEIYLSGRIKFKCPVLLVNGDGATVTLTLTDDMPPGSYRLRGMTPSGTTISMSRPEAFKLSFSDATIWNDFQPVDVWVHYDGSGAGTGEAYWPFIDWYTGSDTYYINNPFITQFGYNDEHAVYLRNETLEGESPGSNSPVREAHIVFSQIVPTAVSRAAEVVAANRLLDASYNWMRTRCRPQKFYRLEVTGLQQLIRPGETIRVSIHRFFDGQQFFNIEDDFLILEVTYDFDQTGLARASVLIGSTDRYPASDVETIADIADRAASGHTDAAGSAYYVESGIKPASKLFGSSDSEPPLIGDRVSSDTNGTRTVIYLAHITDQDMVDGFGASVAFAVEDSSGERHIIGFVSAQRSGADDSGRLVFTPMDGGVAGPSLIVWSDGTVQMAGYGAGYAIFDANGLLSSAAAPAPSAADIAAAIAGAPDKATPIDADTVGLVDSEDSNALKSLSWANIKATLKTYFDTLYNLYVHPNHSGDVTSVGDGATTIAANVVTYAKIQQVATQTLLGRNAAGTGDVTALTALPTNIDALYALLAGRSGGQTLQGGTASADDLKLQSTSHATKGDVRVLDWLAVGADFAPTEPHHVRGSNVLNPIQRIENVDGSSGAFAFTEYDNGTYQVEVGLGKGFGGLFSGIIGTVGAMNLTLLTDSLVRFWISSSGSIWHETPSNFRDLATFYDGIDVTAPDINTPAIVARAAASATENPFEVQDSAGTAVLAVAPSGAITESTGIEFRGGQYEAFRRRSDTVSVSTSSVSILGSLNRMALVHVYGRSGSVYFSDLVMFMSFGGGAQAVSIGAVTFGGAPTRTYTASSANLTLSLSSGTYDVQAVCISRIGDP